MISAMKEKYGVVLVGCGYIGATHLDDIYYRDNIKIVGVVDINEDVAKLFARKYGAESWSTNYRDYLSNDEADIFLIATYTETHLEILKACIAHGKHVLCEKPVADNLDDSLEFIKAARNSQSKVLVGHILRHNKSYQKMAEMIKDGAIGRPKVFRMVQNHHAVNWERYLNLLKHCPPLIDCGVHYIDVAQWFAGSKIVQVSGMSASIDAGLPDHMYNYSMMSARMENGTLFNYESCWSKNIMASNLKEFIGDCGYIKFTLAGDRTDGHELGDQIIWYDGIQNQYHMINVKSIYKNMYGQMCELIRMIENPDYTPSPTLDDVESTMKVAFAADKAIRSGVSVMLDPKTQNVIENKDCYDNVVSF